MTTAPRDPASAAQRHLRSTARRALLSARSQGVAGSVVVVRRAGLSSYPDAGCNDPAVPAMPAVPASADTGGHRPARCHSVRQKYLAQSHCGHQRPAHHTRRPASARPRGRPPGLPGPAPPRQSTGLRRSHPSASHRAHAPAAPTHPTTTPGRDDPPYVTAREMPARRRVVLPRQHRRRLCFAGP